MSVGWSRYLLKEDDPNKPPGEMFIPDSTNPNEPSDGAEEKTPRFFFFFFFFFFFSFLFSFLFSFFSFFSFLFFLFLFVSKAEHKGGPAACACVFGCSSFRNRAHVQRRARCKV
eukprot:COSAG06_NODE_10716_length_1630_cov_1.812541_2_plen_114_part_00